MAAIVPTGFESARAVADAVLHEGYLLYPYRRSSAKNQVRWQFGVLAPRGWLPADDTGVAGSADAWQQQTECLLAAPDSATVHVRLRFLQLQRRSVQAWQPGGGLREVDVLEAGGQRHLTFDEAVPQEVDVAVAVGELRRAPHSMRVEVPGGADTEPLDDDAGRVTRSRRPLSAALRLSVQDMDVTGACPPLPLRRLRVVTENAADSPPPGTPRPEALRTCLVGTHALLGVRGGVFLSLLEPPAWAAAAAKSCRNIHTFPVLAGDRDARDVMLSSPILMDCDYPQVSPESPGELFDATEIDEILSLRTLTLTDEEKREARATDPRAAALIDRVEGIPPDVMERLHGAIRGLRPVGTDPAGTHQLEGRPQP